MTTQRPHWHILGGGAIGSLWACYLKKAGAGVTLILRNPQQVDAFPGRIRLSLGEHRAHYRLDAEPPQADSAIEHLLITTKSYDTEQALQAVRPRLSDRCVLVVMQNGMGAQQQVAETCPDLLVYAGTTTEGAYRERPDRLIHAGRGQTRIGPLNDRATHADEARIASLLATDLETLFDPQIETGLWQKLAINAAINGLTALHQCRNGELAENSAYRLQMAELCKETEALAAKLGQRLFGQPLIEQALAVARATANNYSSMLQDVRHRRVTEIAFINGYICRQAADIDLPVPSHQRLVEAIHRLEQQY